MGKRNKGLILSYINTFLSMICGLFLSSFLLRKLGDAEYGVYQTMSSFANYLVLLEFGAGTVMSRNIASCRARQNSEEEIEKNISTVWSITNILVLVITLASVIFYNIIDYLYINTMTMEQIVHGKRMFIFIVVFLLTSFYGQTLNGIALAFEDYTFSSKNNIIKLILRTCLIITLVLKFDTAIVIVVIDAVIGLGIAIYSYCYCKSKFRIAINCKKLDKKILIASMPLSIAIFTQGIINQANNNVGKFILGIKIGPEEVALYSVAIYIYGIFSSLSTIPLTLYIPQVTKNVVLGFKENELTKTLIQPSRLITLIAGTIVGGFFAAGKPFITIVYGEQYLLAWKIAITIMLPMYIYSAIAISLNVLDAKNKRMGCSIVLLFSTILNVCLTLLLSEKYGIIGVAVSTAISTILGQIIGLSIYCFCTVKINLLYLFYHASKGVLCFQIIGAIVGYMVSSLVNNVYLSFILAGCVYVFISLFGYYFWGKNEYESLAITRFLRIRKKD